MIESTTLELTPSPALGDAAAELLRAAADPVRWAILADLNRGTRCVCDLQAAHKVPPNLLSYHLRVLRDARLVTSSRRGRWIDYSLADDAPARLSAALPTAARRGD